MLRFKISAKLSGEIPSRSKLASDKTITNELMFLAKWIECFSFNSSWGLKLLQHGGGEDGFQNLWQLSCLQTHKAFACRKFLREHISLVPQGPYEDGKGVDFVITRQNLGKACR